MRTPQLSKISGKQDNVIPPISRTATKPAHGNRIRMISQDAETGEDVVRCDLVKGYLVGMD